MQKSGAIFIAADWIKKNEVVEEAGENQKKDNVLNHQLSSTNHLEELYNEYGLEKRQELFTLFQKLKLTEK